MRQRFRPGFWLLLFSMIAMSACTEQINFPAPTITLVGICPSTTSTANCANSIPAGSAQTYLTVRGTNLIQQSQVGFTLSPGGSTSALATNQYISLTEMIVTLPANLLENPNTLYINVTTPQPGGGTYPAQNQTPPPATIFTITPIASGVPVVTSMNPSSAFAGAPGLQLNLNGQNFVSQSTVFVNNSSRATTFLNSTALQVSLDSSDLSTPGPVSIKVVNPPPGGGGSTPVSLNVLTAVPVISAVAPVSVLVGAATTASISITGTGFLNQYSYITMNGQPVTTTITGSTGATASLTAGDLVSAGVNQIQVVNKPPGGGISNIITYAINPTHLLGLPVLVDLAADGSQAINGICGGAANCASGALGLTTATSGPSSSSSGQFVAFASVSHNLVLTDLNTNSDVYVRDTCLSLATCTPVSALVSSDPNGNAANGPSFEPTTDSAGTHAAFTSLATNLVTTVPVQTGTSQVYWRPVCMPAATAPCAFTLSSNFDTQLVSISADGQTAGNGASYNPVISPDGEYVAFVSTATNLVTNITGNGTPQVYIRDTCNIATIVTTSPTNTCVPTTYLVSTPDGTTFANGLSSNPSISEDGLFVSFTSAATNLGSTAPNPNGLPEVFERGTCITTITSTTNTCVSVTTLISTPDGTTPADGPSGQSTLSACGSVTTTTSTACTSSTLASGRFVAFASTASNLVTGVGPTPQQIYVRDTCIGVTITVAQCTPSTTLVSTPDGVTPANGLSEHPSANSSGQLIAFSSFASNLGNTANGVENVFVRNTCLGVIPTCTTGVVLASISSGINASAANGGSVFPSISADGHTVSFLSAASNLVARDNNALEDIFLGTTTF